jgi:rRNA-processing protein FCF1
MTMRPSRHSKRVRVIMDSNAFLVSVQFRIDILEELGRLLNAKPELILLSAVQKELAKLKETGSPKMRKDIVLTMKLADKCVFFKTGEMANSSADDVIVDAASRLKTAVFTNDRQLRKRLRDINVPVIYVRQKSHLSMEGMMQPV